MAEPARQLDDTFSSPTGAFSRGPAQVGGAGITAPPANQAGRNISNIGPLSANNDNERPTANDNESKVEERQDFEQRNIRNVEVTTGKSLKTAGTTAQVVGTGTQVTGVTTQATGKVMQVSGKTVKVVGKGLDAGGTALMRAGVAMSGTGVGAIVGVPTAILGAGVKVTGVAAEVGGAALNATGKAVDKTGKVVNKTGKAVHQTGGKVKKLGKGIESQNLPLRRDRGKIGLIPMDKVNKAAKFIPGPTGKALKYGGVAATVMWEKRKVTRANATIFSVGFSLYPLHLALVIASLGALGASATLIMISASIESASKAVLGSTITYYLGKAIATVSDAFSAAFSKFFGFAPFAAFDPANWFIGLQYLAVVFGWGILTFAVITYLVSMINPFTGKGAAWKMGGFIIAAFAYLVPGINILPWFALYTFCVWKNPE
ncbi:MAG: hypothetical protein RLZZ480_500 [Candidatus Parcubacteria bacterium]|jgi:hypothetical protein